MEYVKLDPSEQIYGKKHLLHSQMEILYIMKRYKEFTKLRKLELKLKTLLKKKVSEVKEETKLLETILPKVKHADSEEKTLRDYPKKRSDLEDEIDDIRRKLAELQ